MMIGPRVNPEAMKAQMQERLDQKRKLFEQKEDTEQEEKQQQTVPQKESVVIELSPEEILAIKVVMSEKKAAALEEELIIYKLKEARQRLLAVVKDEAIVTARIAHAHGLKDVTSVRVLGGNKIACSK